MTLQDELSLMGSEHDCTIFLGQGASWKLRTLFTMLERMVLVPQSETSLFFVVRIFALGVRAKGAVTNLQEREFTWIEGAHIGT